MLKLMILHTCIISLPNYIFGRESFTIYLMDASPSALAAVHLKKNSIHRADFNIII